MTFDGALAAQIAGHYADTGYHEGPNNRNDFSRWQYGDYYEPWCASFVSWCAYSAGFRFGDATFGDKGENNVGMFRRWAQRHGLWRDRTYRAQPGDLIVLTFGIPDQHIEMVQSDPGFPNAVATIGGNTNDECARRTRTRGNIVGFIALTATAPAPPPPVPPVPPKVTAMFDPPFDIHNIVAAAACPSGGAWILGIDGAVFAFAGAPYWGGMQGHLVNAQGQPRTPAKIEVHRYGFLNHKTGYRITFSDGSAHNLPEGS